MLSEEARKLRNETAKRYRQAHPDKVRESRERYWERKAAEQAARKRKRRGADSNGQTA